MIISKTPFRISLVGGGTDQSYYYKDSPGVVVSFAINKYMYINLNKSFSDNYRIAYSKIEIVKNLQEIKHPLVRFALENFELRNKYEIVSIADIPSNGTGLGSSSAFAVGMIKILDKLLNLNSNTDEIARLACKLEIELNKSPIGKQDQYAVSFGGLNQITFNCDDSVTVSPINLENDFQKEFFANMIIFYTNIGRSTNILLNKSREMDKLGRRVELNDLRDLAISLPNLIQNQNIKEIGKIVYENHLIKTKMNPESNNEIFSDVISNSIKFGAYGGKILGAGGGGFGLLIGPKVALDKTVAKYSNIQFMKFGIDLKGSQIIYNDGN
jgi:D-glycero-alpha-D-manno-heptose-7-phosphate kinase